MSNVPALPGNDAVVGLEDFDQNDMVMPTLSIDHKEGEFVDNLSGERHKEIEVVLLGLVKQRILWPGDMGADGEPPLCKSFEFATGRPPKPANFPWKASGFSMADYLKGDDEDVVLPCSGCKLQEWGTHPKNDSPWCAEQHTFALLLPVGDGYSPATLTIQRTAIKPSRAYMTSFQRSKSPLFVVTTKLGLNVNRKGTVVYSVPWFVRGEPTDAAEHEEYGNMYRRIASFLRTPRSMEPVVEDEEADDGAPAAPAQPVNVTPSAAAAGDDGDELPF